jgi:hypothetical protein
MDKKDTAVETQGHFMGQPHLSKYKKSISCMHR